MLKHRNSCSILSSKLSKTLSRPKFTNKTQQQVNNSYIDSVKQAKTLRAGSKNKSCYIPKHLAQSTESHIVSNKSVSSNNFKSTAKQCSGNSIKGQNLHRNHQNRDNFISSSFTIAQNQKPHLSYVMNNDSRAYNLESYQPFLSVQQHLNSLDFNSNPFSLLNQQNLIKNPNQTCNLTYNNSSIGQGFNKKAKNQDFSVLRQKILQKQVKDMFLYKSKQLTKILQQMHRFCICVKELKWICQETHHLIKHYNEKINFYYQQTFQQFSKKSDIQNMVKQSGLLLQRFNELEYLNTNEQGLLNFNIFSNKIINQSVDGLHDCQGKIADSKEKSKSALENPHSWSKLIDNMKQEQIKVKPFVNNEHFAKNCQQPLISTDENKNVTIRTFQITENNSPFKNKTLNELIRLSQLRKTQFRSEFGSQNKQNNQFSLNTTENQEKQSRKNNFSKKQFKITNTIAQQQFVSQKDPFDSIHIPHFNNKNVSQKDNTADQKASIEQRRLLQNQIRTLNIKILDLDKENNEYFRKLKGRNVQLEKINQEMNSKNIFLTRQITDYTEKSKIYMGKVEKLVEKTINQLINCHQMNSKTNNRTTFNKSNQIYAINTLSQSEKFMQIPYKSFQELIVCLQKVLELSKLGQTKAHKGTNPTQPPKNTPLARENSTYETKNYVKSLTQNHELRQNKQILLADIKQLEQIKKLASDEIQKMSMEIQNLAQEMQKIQNYQTQAKKNILSKTRQQIPMSHQSVNERVYEMQQMLFLQAFTIEQILQMNQEHGEKGYENV